jgi:hypothetical protein
MRTTRPALAAAMRPQWNEWVEKANGMGWPGQEILDETARLMTLYDRN